MTVKLHDTIELAVDLPEEGLTAGSVGAIVHIFHEPTVAYEVEFTDDAGRTIAMTTLTPDQLRRRS